MMQAQALADSTCLLTLAFVVSGTMLGSWLAQDAALQKRQLLPSADRRPPCTRRTRILKLVPLLAEATRG